MVKGLIEGEEAKEYDEIREKYPNTKVYDKFIINNVKSGKNVAVADICCGTGKVIALLSGKVGFIAGVDASKDMIGLSKDKFGERKDVKIMLAESDRTGLDPDSFDYVTIRMGLHHIKRKKETIDENYRILKKGGKLIIIDRAYDNFFSYHIKSIIRLPTKDGKRYFNHYIKSKKKNFELFGKFKIIKEESIKEEEKQNVSTFMVVLEK